MSHDITPLLPVLSAPIVEMIEQAMQSKEPNGKRFNGRFAEVSSLSADGVAFWIHLFVYVLSGIPHSKAHTTHPRTSDHRILLGFVGHSILLTITKTCLFQVIHTEKIFLSRIYTTLQLMH